MTDSGAFTLWLVCIVLDVMLLLGIVVVWLPVNRRAWRWGMPVLLWSVVCMFWLVEMVTLQTDQHSRAIFNRWTLGLIVYTIGTFALYVAMAFLGIGKPHQRK